METMVGMRSMNGVTERRKRVRYPVKAGAAVGLEQTRFLNLGKPKSIKLGSIVNICEGGLSALYPGDNLRSTTANRLSISMPEANIRIKDIPFRTISDFEVWMPESSEPARRCGVKFGKLNTKQKLLLHDFIRECTLPLEAQPAAGLI